MKKLCTWLILFLILFAFPVWATITAEYTAHPLYFKPFDNIYRDYYGGVGGNPYNGKMALHLGTTTINTHGGTVTSIALNSGLSAQYVFNGPRLANNNPVDLGFFSAAILKYGTQLTASSLDQGARNPINPVNTTMMGIITVDFFLISYEPANVFISDGIYTHASGILNTFSLTFSDSAPFWNSAAFEYVQDENGNPFTNLPYLINGSPTFTETVPYGDPPEQTNYDFLITNKQAISLADAVGNRKAKVAEAQITITNGQANKEYGINVIFTNQANTNPFRLTMQNVNNPPTIPYSLFFNNQLVIPGGDNEWTGLHNGTKSLDIMVTGISADDANKALAGSYQDVIIVNISPLDT